MRLRWPNVAWLSDTLDFPGPNDLRVFWFVHIKSGPHSTPCRSLPDHNTPHLQHQLRNYATAIGLLKSEGAVLEGRNMRCDHKRESSRVVRHSGDIRYGDSESQLNTCARESRGISMDGYCGIQNPAHRIEQSP